MSLEPLCVALKERSYPIAFGRLPEQAAELARQLKSRKVLLVSDENVAAAGHVSRFLDALKVYQIVPEVFLLPPGEVHKRLSAVESIAEVAARHRLNRQSAMLALGGGVSGDITGFAASIYLRGIDFFQLPTTLLAAVDSSVGGKTGADLACGKNLVGSFYQPQGVYVIPEFLGTLPEAEWRNGLAEIVKYAWIMSPELLAMLEKDTERWNQLQPDAYLPIIRHCCECKAKIVSEDERESGVRAILNYGHTAGHAIEQCSDYVIPHGQAVAMGMCVAARLAWKMQIFSAENEARQERLLISLALPVRIPGSLHAEMLLEKMFSDKKNHADNITMILPTAPGQVRIIPAVDLTLLQKTLQELTL